MAIDQEVRTDRAYSLRGRVDNAIALASRGAAVASEFLAKSEAATDPADQAFYMGMAAYEAKDFDSAREFLLQSHEIEPRTITAARLAMVGYRVRDWTFALDWIERAMRSDNDGVLRAHVLDFEISYESVRALALANLGKVDEAIARSTAVIERRPDVIAFRARSTAYLSVGRVHDAIIDLRRGRAVAPPSLQNELAADVDLLERMQAAELSGMPVIGEMSISAWPV